MPLGLRDKSQSDILSPPPLDAGIIMTRDTQIQILYRRSTNSIRPPRQIFMPFNVSARLVEFHVQIVVVHNMRMSCIDVIGKD